MLVACGGDEDETCDPVAQSGCEDGQVCEQVQDGEPACFAPVEVHGKVLDLGTNAGVGGARVVAVDVNQAAASSVAISASDGTYALPVPAIRNADGTPAAFPVTLHADAQGYQSFPGPVRTALPLDVANATEIDDTLVLQSAITDIGLIADDGGGAGSITGTVGVPDDGHGVIIVAESGGVGFSGIASRDGDYTIFNLPAGHYSVTAYSVGHVYGVGEVDVAAASVKLDLALTDEAAGALNGTVSIVNPGDGNATSVLAFIESTFDPVTGRGVPPPGLRAPQTGVPNVSGAFTLDGIPPGKYVIVAAFENDNLGRDPDHCISGTADVHVTIGAGQTAEAPTTFKVTGSLGTISPGAIAAEPVTGTPTFSWVDDSSEDQYIVELFDAFGQMVWTKTIPGVSGGSPTATYDGANPLIPGMFYQWRVTSAKASGGGGELCELSRTEDLKGVFFVP
jgi:hypothetical protein